MAQILPSRHKKKERGLASGSLEEKARQLINKPSGPAAFVLRAEAQHVQDPEWSGYGTPDSSTTPHFVLVVEAPRRSEGVADPRVGGEASALPARVRKQACEGRDVVPQVMVLLMRAVYGGEKAGEERGLFC